MRPHVPRFGTPPPPTGSPRRSTATSTPRPIPADPACRRSQSSTTTATCRACRWTEPTPGRSGRTCSRCCRTTPTIHGLVARAAAARRSSATSPTSTASTWSRRGLVELAVLLEDAHRRPRPPLEDPLDAELRPVLGHAGAERTIADMHGEVDPGAAGRLQSSLADRDWDSIEALWQHEGARSRPTPSCARRSSGDTAADVLARARGHRAPGGAFRPRARAVRQRVRPQGHLVARVRLPDVVRAAGADHRGPARLPRDRLRLPGGDRRRARRPRGPVARADRSRARRRGARPVQAALDLLAEA